MKKKLATLLRTKKYYPLHLIHPSFTKDYKLKKNIIHSEFERLEFLGDRVLGLVISSLIYSRFISLNEGDLSKKLSYLVTKKLFI